MSDEKKGLIVSVFFGVTELVFSIIATVKFASGIMIINILLSILLISALIFLFLKYRRAVDSYEFIQFLYYGSEYNGFNLFPRLKIYMDYLKVKNSVEVGTVRFQCVDNSIEKTSHIEWKMENIYNKTQKAIESYFFYTANEYGVINGVDIEVKEGDQTLSIDTGRIKKKNLIQQTPFTFSKPIEPGEMIPEMAIKMKMEEEFADLKEKIVYLYPRNYGKKVNQMYITYKHNKDKKVSVILHEIGKDKNGYCDKAIRTGMAKKENGQWNYNFYLKQQEININNLYYLFIEEKE